MKKFKLTFKQNGVHNEVFAIAESKGHARLTIIQQFGQVNFNSVTEVKAPQKTLLCKKGNEYFEQGKTYPIVKEYADGFYKVKAEDVFYSHIASNDLTDIGECGIAEFELVELEKVA